MNNYICCDQASKGPLFAMSLLAPWVFWNSQVNTTQCSTAVLEAWGQEDIWSNRLLASTWGEPEEGTGMEGWQAVKATSNAVHVNAARFSELRFEALRNWFSRFDPINPEKHVAIIFSNFSWAPIIHSCVSSPWKLTWNHVAPEFNSFKLCFRSL